MWCSGGTLLTGTLYETRNMWGGLIKVKTKPKVVNSIFTDHKEHTVELGITRHGKTWAGIKSLERLNGEAVLFFNTQHEKVGKGWTTVDPSLHEWDQVEALLQKNRKINWLPSTDLDEMQKEIIFIVKQLYNGEKRNLRFAIDEVHLFTKEALNQIRRVATTGLRWGIRGVFISQRPAKVDNTLYTQSTNHVIFALGNADYTYLKGQGFPSEEIMLKVDGEPYVFVTYNQKETSDLKTIKN